MFFVAVFDLHPLLFKMALASLNTDIYQIHGSNCCLKQNKVLGQDLPDLLWVELHANVANGINIRCKEQCLEQLGRLDYRLQRFEL